MQLPTSQQMQELDHRTIDDLGIPGCVLMENAGRGTVDFMEHHFGPVHRKAVIILAGPGNNGGDGLVIARTVLSRGGRPVVYFPFSPDTLKGDAELNFRILVNFGIDFKLLNDSNDIERAERDILNLQGRFGVHTIVDSLFGTGLVRTISGIFKQTVDLINRLQKEHSIPVTSADIPSGIHGDTGQTMGCSVVADLTVTYGFPQPGHFHNGGEAVGKLEIVDIGIPSTLLKEIPPAGYVLTGENLPRLRNRSLPSHKGTNGHLLILAGSTGKTGAAILAGRGALAGGAGLVTLAVPSELNPVFETSLAEAMTVPLVNSSTFFQGADLEQIMELSRDKNCIILGPGLGTDEKTAALTLELYRKCPQPMVIDADGLNILAADKQCLAAAAGPRVLTPHPGEMARLLDLSITEIQNDRASAACMLRERLGQSTMEIITVLKGAGTVISPISGPWCINTTGNPGMAAGGMGDVLAGIIGSLISQGYSPWEAACLGVYLHGFGADLLAESQPFGYTASDVAKKIPETIGIMFQRRNTL